MPVRILNYIIATTLCFTVYPLYAADSYVLSASSSQTITAHSTCAEVTNGGAKSIMVPTKSTGEWQSFRDNPPPSVSLGGCCPTNYVLVPGDSEQGTSDFCVMKYEAKNVGGVATSQPELAPWGNITAGAAATACTSLGTGYDLITNEQWQTIVRNAEYVDANWSGGSRGQGCLYRGNTATSTTCSYSVGGGFDSGTSRNALAKFTLSNGVEIWDIAGNITERVKGTYTASPTGNYVGVGGVGWASAISGTNKLKYGPKGDYPSGCPGDSQGWCGLGFMALQSSASGVHRGGSIDDPESDAFYTHMGYGTSAYSYVGFRCVYNL